MSKTSAKTSAKSSGVRHYPNGRSKAICLPETTFDKQLSILCTEPKGEAVKLTFVSASQDYRISYVLSRCGYIYRSKPFEIGPDANTIKHLAVISHVDKITFEITKLS